MIDGAKVGSKLWAPRRVVSPVSAGIMRRRKGGRTSCASMRVSLCAWLSTSHAHHAGLYICGRGCTRFACGHVSGRIMGGHNCEWAQVGAHLRTRHAHPATPTCMTHARFAHGLTHKAKPHAQDGTSKRLGTTGGALGHEWATTRNTLIPRHYNARIMGAR